MSVAVKAKGWERISAPLAGLGGAYEADFRRKLIAKVKTGKLTMTFTTADPTQPAVLSHMHVDFGISIFFRERSARTDVVSSNFRRVKPYDDRFKATGGAPTIFGF